MTNRLPQERHLGLHPNQQLVYEPTLIESASAHLKLILPARAQYLKVLRSIIASMAVGMDFSVERIDDLKIAVVESCSPLLSAGGTGQLTVVAQRTPDGLRLRASLRSGVTTWPPAGIESSLTWMVLSTVASDVSFGKSEEGSFVQLFVSRDGSEGARSAEAVQ